MNELLEIDSIINKKHYPKIYNPFYIISFIILILIYIINIYEYQSYLIYNGAIKNNKLEILVSNDDIKEIDKYNTLLIDNKYYSYNLSSIKNNDNNTKYIYLEIQNLSNIENYPYEIKIIGEKKRIAKYLKEYL